MKMEESRLRLAAQRKEEDEAKHRAWLAPTTICMKTTSRGSLLGMRSANLFSYRPIIKRLRQMCSLSYVHCAWRKCLHQSDILRSCWFNRSYSVLIIRIFPSRHCSRASATASVPVPQEPPTPHFQQGWDVAQYQPLPEQPLSPQPQPPQPQHTYIGIFTEALSTINNHWNYLIWGYFLKVFFGTKAWYNVRNKGFNRVLIVALFLPPAQS